MISATDDKWTALWYALVYACPHFDALTALMQERVFRERVQRALERDQTTRAQRDMVQRILSRFLRHRYSSPRVLHIDFGCGPGTASWAAIKLLSGRATVVTVGHDHNRHMIKLARTITADVAKPQRNITNLFFSNWDKFKKKSIRLASKSWSAVIVTANSIFSQPSIDEDDITEICAVIADTHSHASDSLLLTLGTHPSNYEQEKIAGAWQRIASIADSEVLYDGDVNFGSWNPVRPGRYKPSDDEAWHAWHGQTRQRAHVIKVKSR